MSHDRPSEHAIIALVRKFRETYSLHDVAHPTRAHPVRTAETIAAMDESVAEDPNLSIRRRPQRYSQ